jgi:hypothetical protein
VACHEAGGEDRRAETLDERFSAPRHVLALRARGEYDIRIDRLPYYERPQIPNPPPSPMTRAST